MPTRSISLTYRVLRPGIVNRAARPEAAAACGSKPSRGGVLSAATAIGSGSQSSSAAEVSFSGFQGASAQQSGTVNVTFNGTPVVQQSSYGTTVALGSFGRKRAA